MTDTFTFGEAAEKIASSDESDREEQDELERLKCQQCGGSFYISVLAPDAIYCPWCGDGKSGEWRKQ